MSGPAAGSRIAIAGAAVLAAALGACEDHRTASRPVPVSESDPTPATQSGAAKRSAERIESKIGDYQQTLIDQIDADSGGRPPAPADRPDR